MSVMEQPVLFSTHRTESGHQVGHALLNLPKSLNALNLTMVQLLLEQLTAWQQDSSVVAVVLSGAGEKAFCAGGDVVSLHNAMKSNPGQIPSDAKAFFTQEYALDYLIHTYQKPIIVLGTGIVMGGGMGLFAGASHRVVNETTRMAMPEITIGLFPDVGGSYFLSKMPNKLGLFLGLTGVQFNGSDAMHVGLADFAIAGITADSLIEDFTHTPWQQDAISNGGIVSELLVHRQTNSEPLPASKLQAHQDIIEGVLSAADDRELFSNLKKLAKSEDKWLQRAGQTFASGSPITVRLVLEQLRRATNLSLLECFKMELNMACECTAVGEFQEGVRALLIDKDGEPNWQYKNPEDVPTHVIEQFFSEHWPEEHPLSHLSEV